MEAIDADVISVANACLAKSGWRADKTMEEAIDFLESQSIFDIDYLTDWIATSGSEYPAFLQNMLATESLRMATIKYLKAVSGRDELSLN